MSEIIEQRAVLKGGYHFVEAVSLLVPSVMYDRELVVKMRLRSNQRSTLIASVLDLYPPPQLHRHVSPQALTTNEAQ